MESNWKTVSYFHNDTYEQFVEFNTLTRYVYIVKSRRNEIIFIMMVEGRVLILPKVYFKVWGLLIICKISS